MKKVCIFLSLILSNSFAYGQPPAKLLENISIFGQCESLTGHIVMSVHSHSGIKERELELFLLRKDNQRKTYMHVVAPVFLSKLKFLTHRNSDGREIKWLATSHGVRRLSQANRNDPLFDSDFSVEDLSEFDTSEYTTSVHGESEINGAICTLFELKPYGRDKKQLRKILYIEQKNGFLHGVDYYSHAGAVIKKYRVLSIMTVGEDIFPEQCRMDNIQKGTHTIIEVINLDTVTPIPSRVFNKAGL